MVELLLGKKEAISFSDEEGTYGSAETTVEKFGRNATFDPNRDSQNIIQIKSAGTEVIDVPARDFGAELWGGVVSYVPQNWKFLKFVFLKQSSDVTDTGSDPYTHTFTETNEDLLSFTMERAIQATTDRVRRYEGCQVQSYGLAWDSSDPGGFLTATANIFAEDANNGTSTTSLTAPTTEGFKPRHTTLTLEDSEVSYLKTGTLTINNGLTDGMYARYGLGRLKEQSAPTLRTYNLSATAHYTDDTFFDMFDSANVLTGTNSIEFKRGTNDTLTFTFTGGYLNSPPDPTNLDGPNVVSLNLEFNSAAIVAVDSLNDYETFT